MAPKFISEHFFKSKGVPKIRTRRSFLNNFINFGSILTLFSALILKETSWYFKNNFLKNFGFREYKSSFENREFFLHREKEGLIFVGLGSRLVFIFLRLGTRGVVKCLEFFPDESSLKTITGTCKRISFFFFYCKKSNFTFLCSIFFLFWNGPCQGPSGPRGPPDPVPGPVI